MNCEVCKAEMQQIPAGVSKSTGKPYNAFMACPNKCKKGATKQEPNWDKIREEKQSNIAASVAVNKVCDLIAAGKLEIGGMEAGAQRIYAILTKLSKQPF